MIKIVEKEHRELEPQEIGLDFEVPLGNIWINLKTEKSYQWVQRWLVVKSNALAYPQIKGLENRFGVCM